MQIIGTSSSVEKITLDTPYSLITRRTEEIPLVQNILNEFGSTWSVNTMRGSQTDGKLTMNWELRPDGVGLMTLSFAHLTRTCSNFLERTITLYVGKSDGSVLKRALETFMSNFSSEIQLTTLVDVEGSVKSKLQEFLDKVLTSMTLCKQSGGLTNEQESPKIPSFDQQDSSTS